MTSFAHMSRSEKRDQIISEGATNETQITMDPLDVDMLLAALESTPKRKLVENYSDYDSLHIIADNWGIDMSKFPALHHERDFCPSSWDTRSLATLAVLSEFTPGQGDRMGSFLCSAVELRVGNGRVQKDLWVKEVEIKRVIRDELKPLREPGEENELVRKRKSKHDEKQKAAKQKKRSGADMEGALDEIVMEDMGQKLMGARIPDNP